MRHRNLAPASRASSCREDSPRSTASGVGMAAGGGARYPGVPPPSGNKGRRRKPLPRLRGLGCAGSWCKPQDLSPERSGPSVPAMAADMLHRGWVTNEEYTQLLMGDRLYCMHEAAEARGEGQVENNEPAQGSTSSKKSRPGLMRGLSRRKSGKCMKTVGAAHSSKGSSTPEKKKTELPADRCRDPITLDDLGSWTWDFHASEAATPPVSCGGTLTAPKSCVDVAKRGKEGRIGGKGRSSSWKGKGKGKGRSGGLDGCGNSNSSSSSCSSSAVVTYNVESLVLYLLESGDFQEPTTRRPFSLVQLADLDALAAKAGAKVKGSLVKSYQEGQAKYRERRELREMLVGADRCLGDVVSEMLSTIEDSEEPHEEAHVYLVTLFPQFSHIFSELKEADEEFARQCLDQYKGTLRGPPNHPTQEQGGLLRTAMEFLNEQGRGMLDETVDANDQHQPGDVAYQGNGNVVDEGEGEGASDQDDRNAPDQGNGNVADQGDDGVVVAAESNMEGSETGEGEGDAVSDDGSMSVYSL